ncbi:MAG: S49 family peptidase [Mucilaginibacter polytrichastri]|nr:S49 family peptidase [Mucilaginibacter polytrichastri]
MMKLNRLASAILRGSFLIEPRFAEGLMPTMHAFLEGKPVSFFDDDEDEDPNLAAYVITAEGKISRIGREASAGGENIFAGAPPGSIAVIPISGTIMKDSYCGSVGTSTMSAWLRDVQAAENMIGAVLHINSGGGSVEGTAEFAAIIKEVDQEKPVIAYTDGMMASAAYWIGSSTRKIIMSSETVEIGSIGTAINFTDYSKYYEKMGITRHYINADPSIDKNQDYYKALAGNYEPMRTNILNPTNAVFLDAVKANRPGLVLTDVKAENGETYQEPLTGKMYVGQAAIDNGLADEFGTMAVALDSVKSQADAGSLIAQTTHTDMKLFGSDFPKLNALANKKAEEITEADLKSANEELAEKGISLIVLTAAAIAEADKNADAATAAEGVLATITASLEGVEGAKTGSLTEAAASIIADRDAANKKAAEYGDQPGAKPSNPVTTAKSEGGEQLDEKLENAFETSFDREAKALFGN